MGYINSKSHIYIATVREEGTIFHVEFPDIPSAHTVVRTDNELALRAVANELLARSLALLRAQNRQLPQANYKPSSDPPHGTRHISITVTESDLESRLILPAHY